LMRGANPCVMLDAHRTEFDWSAEVITSARTFVGMLMVQQCERANTLENIVTATIFGLGVMNCRARNGSFPLRGSLVEATGKEFSQRRVRTDRKQPVGVLSQASALQWLALLRRNRSFIVFCTFGVPGKQTAKIQITTRV